MADEDKEAENEETEEAASSGKKKGIILGGGTLSLVGMAYFAFLMAVPGGVKDMSLEGPFVANLTEEQLSFNLAQGKNYLALGFKAEYVAYDEAYVTDRIVDPLYEAMLIDRTLIVVSAKSKDEVNDATGKEILKEELRAAIDPILFPIHIGDTASPSDPDPTSGLAVGASTRESSFRGLFHDHMLLVDEPDLTITFDGGQKVVFEAGDADVRVVTPSGDTLYVDVTGLEPGFVGEVRVGAHGRIRDFLFSKFLVQ